MNNDLPHGMSERMENMDLEHLLESKRFAELSAEEVAFLKEMGVDEAEYESLQNVHKAMLMEFSAEEEIEPSTQVEADLMAAFRKKNEKKAAIPFWTRVGDFLFPKGSLLGQPGFQIAGLTAVVVIIVLMIPANDKQEVAQIQPKEDTIGPEGVKPPTPAEEVEFSREQQSGEAMAEKAKGVVPTPDESEIMVLEEESMEEKSLERVKEDRASISQPVFSQTEVADEIMQSPVSTAYQRDDNLRTEGDLMAKDKRNVNDSTLTGTTTVFANSGVSYSAYEVSDLKKASTVSRNKQASKPGKKTDADKNTSNSESLGEWPELLELTSIAY